ATYPNQDIPKLLEFIGEYDMVIGARIGKNVAKDSIIRRILKYLIRKLACYMSRTNIPDLNSGLRVIRKEVALKYFYLLPDSHSWESTITLAFLCNGHPVKFVPVDYYKRKGKSTFHPINDTYNYISLTIRTIMYFNPLRIFLPISFILFSLGILKLLHEFFILKQNHIGGLVIALVLSSLLIVVLGLIADLIVVLHRK
ncbi:MAG: glycosyltransferase family 2 protein, partial [Elusimicrobiota bacterium]|nr:glycosyltransferase family 2 protein [Elusimicrobiota bacterium]